MNSIKHLFHRHGQRDERIWPRLRRILNGRHGAGIAQHWINQQPHVRVVEQEGCVPDELDPQWGFLNVFSPKFYWNLFS
jgi:hypothetical protein